MKLEPKNNMHMRWRLVLWTCFGVIALVAVMGGLWILSLPPVSTTSAAPLISKEEADATIEALKPPKRQRPLIAIIGINDATEVTDYLIPCTHQQCWRNWIRNGCRSA